MFEWMVIFVSLDPFKSLRKDSIFSIHLLSTTGSILRGVLPLIEYYNLKLVLQI